MIAPRFRKVIRDLFTNKGRTMLVVLAISVGVFAFGSVFITQELLLKNINDSFLKSQASTITLSLSSFDDSLVDWTKTRAGVKQTQGKAVYSAKILRNGKEELVSLISIPDYSQIKLNTLVPLRGSWPPKKGEISLERNSYKLGKFVLGETLEISVSNDKNKMLSLTSEVYDNSAIPYMFTRQMTAFVSWDTLGLLGYRKQYNQLEIATNENIKSLSEAQKLTNDLTNVIKDRGVIVYSTQVAKPNQHWATDNSKAFTAILSVIGTFSLILSGFLVINTISALLTQQKKQIGIMKSIGAKQGQITSLYLIMVSFYGVLALVIALPIGMFLGYLFLNLVTNFLNLDINSFYLPPKVFFLEIAAALVVPIISAVLPIVQSAKKPVRVALSDHQGGIKIGKVDRLLAKVGGESRVFSLATRNVFRNKGRLVLTLGTLIVAGALFMAVLNVRQSMFKEIERILGMYDFSVSINLAGDYSSDAIISRLNGIAHVTDIEARNAVNGFRIKSDNSKGSEFTLSGLPANTIFSHPIILSGRWLSENGNNEVVLTSSFVRDNPDLAVGSELEFSVEQHSHKLNVVGIISMSGGGGERLMNFSTFDVVSKIKDTPSVASSYLVKTEPNDAVTQIDVEKEVVDKLEKSNIVVGFKQTKNDIISAASSQFNFMIFFLLTMAIMVAIVGGLGLAGTMSLNVMERTREIGIMRSIGAGDKSIRNIVLLEGIMVGVISFFVAIPVSLPLSFGLCYAIGTAFFGRSLVVAVVPLGVIVWFLIISVIAVIASMIPARRASRMSISETLSYE